MKYKIVSPTGKEEIKEFNSYEEMRHYLGVKNNDIYRDDVQTEKVNFPLGVIE